MTALVSPQPTILISSTTPSTGILLNPRSVSAPPIQEYSKDPSLLHSSSSSVSESQSRSPPPTLRDSVGRKIRFAPLPDPRRDQSAQLSDHDDSDSESSFAHHNSAPPTNPTPSPSASNHSLQHFDPTDVPAPRARLKSKKWGQKLLGPLFHPRLTGKSSEDALSQAYNPDGSKYANIDATHLYKGGAPLGRFTSASGFTSTRETERSQELRGGAPLTHIVSETGKGRKGRHRMLNGHVYGRRYSVDPNAVLEPEFVEWGYGGMGSVNNDHSRGRGGNNVVLVDWAKVQSTGRAFGDAESGEHQDDGSGMGWVKRRREQREREIREKEELQKLDKEHGLPSIEVHPPESEEKEQPPTRKSDSEGGVHHVYQAVSVPAPSHHSWHHAHSKGGETSGTATPTSVPSPSRSNFAGTVPKVKHGDNRLSLIVNTENEGSSSSADSFASRTSSESLRDEDEEEDTTERDSDEEEEEAEESRVTSKSAGVEKISRHKE